MNPEQVSLAIDSDKSVPDFLKNRLNELSNDINIVQIGSNIHRIKIPDEIRNRDSAYVYENNDAGSTIRGGIRR